MILQAQLALDMSLHEVMPPILRLITFSVRQRVLYLQHQNHYHQFLRVVSDRAWSPLVSTRIPYASAADFF